MRSSSPYVLLAATLALWAPLARAADLISFWDARPRHGANVMNEHPPGRAFFTAARTAGAEWVRLAYDKWPSTQRDFLIGNADEYRGLVADDLATLRRAIDDAQKAGLVVVVAPLSLPGMRWRQNNGDELDGRVWQYARYWQQTAAFWKDLARALADLPGVAAYNVVNEPAPEYGGDVDEDASVPDLIAWYARVKGTHRDLPAFYEQVVAAIRTVDNKTAVMLDGGWYASGHGGLAYWPDALTDDRILYAFHMYEPYAWSNPKNHRSPEPLTYPGPVNGERWDRSHVADWLAPTYAWAEDNGIARGRIVAAEFGCHRRSPGCGTYLNDVLTVVEGHETHWAVYSWREDGYDGYDYEVGDTPLPAGYFLAKERGKPMALKRRPNPIWRPVGRRLARTRP